MYDNPTCFSWYSVWNIVILQNMLNFRWRSSIRTACRLHCQCSIRRILWRTGKWWCYKWGLYFILLPFYLILCSLCIWIIPWHMKWTSYYKSLRDMDLHSKEIFLVKCFLLQHLYLLVRSYNIAYLPNSALMVPVCTISWFFWKDYILLNILPLFCSLLSSFLTTLLDFPYSSQHLEVVACVI